MEIEHFVSYSKEPEGLCSTGCAFVAYSVPCLRRPRGSKYEVVRPPPGCEGSAHIAFHDQLTSDSIVFPNDRLGNCKFRGR